MDTRGICMDAPCCQIEHRYGLYFEASELILLNGKRARYTNAAGRIIVVVVGCQLLPAVWLPSTRSVN
jgi:hypothetical protein